MHDQDGNEPTPVKPANRASDGSSEKFSRTSGACGNIELLSERLQQILDAWAARHGVAFAWRPDFTIAYTNSKGAWFVSTLPINGDDDWIAVHPTGDGEKLELEKMASAGHVEVLRLSVGQLETELDAVLDWFEGWTAFFAEGPGKGH